MLLRLLCPALALIALFFSACVNPDSSPSLAGSITTAPGAPPPKPTNGPGNGLIGTATLDSEELAFVTLINNYRTQSGAPPLQISVALTESSDWMSTDMAVKNYLNHFDNLGRDPFARMLAFGYPFADYSGENIAAGYANAQDTFMQWKNSPGHNANMLDSSYLAMGVGRAYNPASQYGWYWTTDFGSTVDLAVPLPRSLERSGK